MQIYFGSYYIVLFLCKSFCKVLKLLVMFECLFQCDNKEHFIERIKGMDLEVQKSLVEYIQQVTDFFPSTLTVILLAGFVQVLENPESPGILL